MTDVVVLFVGPTLARTEALMVMPDAVILPPAKQGDVYAAWLQYKPAAIGIIDGFFENVPAPWHKEILWVMTQGVRVYGASSMGALRAVELYTFGMVGVGAVFEAYKSGQLEDDDEVALIHGPPELGYPGLSEAMVNIRQTLKDARHENIISQAMFEHALKYAKTLFYRDRSYTNLFASLKDISGFEKDIAGLEQWLPKGRRDVKKEDALLLLGRMKSDEYGSVIPVSYDFQDTEFWRNMKRHVEEEMV